MNTQDFMEELMVMMLTEKKVNNIYKNEVSFWIDCGCERGLHYDIDCYDDFDEWYTDALRIFSDWYVSCRINIYELEISSKMVFDVIQEEGSEYLNNFDDIDEFNKYIILILLNNYLQNDNNINVKKFKKAMMNNYNKIKESEQIYICKDCKRDFTDEVDDRSDWESTKGNHICMNCFYKNDNEE